MVDDDELVKAVTGAIHSLRDDSGVSSAEIARAIIPLVKQAERAGVGYHEAHATGYAVGYAAGAAGERADVVKWLRNVPVTGAYSSDIIGGEYRHEFAAAIEAAITREGDA